ncbi:hypothetical protein Tco_0522155 [Tanacetum coccineum]
MLLGFGRLPSGQTLGMGCGKGLDWVEEGLGKRVRLVSRDVEAFEVVAGKSLRGESLLAAGPIRFRRWVLCGTINGEIGCSRLGSAFKVFTVSDNCTQMAVVID